MAAVAGLRGTGDWGTDERPKNFRELILWADPNGSAPLTALMSKMRKQTTDDPEFAWWEEELKPIRVQVSATATTTATALTIATTGDATALDFVAGDLLLLETLESTVYGFELVEVASDPSASNALTVTRGAANTSANSATIATNAYLLKVGSAFEEGTGAPKSTTRNPTKYSNYTQIFKTTYSLTGTAEQTNVRTGDPLKNDKKRKAFDHAVAMEQALLFGKPYETTGSGGKPKRYTGGLYHYLAANYNATTKPTIKIFTTTTITEDDILDATYGMWDYNVPESGNERIAFCGNGFLNKMNKIIKSGSDRINMNYTAPTKVYGMQFTRWEFPQGSIYMRSHPLMNINSRFTNGCFIINPPGVRYRPLRNRDTTFKDNVQANDSDSRKGQWMGELGAEFNYLRSMRYISLNLS